VEKALHSGESIEDLSTAELRQALQNIYGRKIELEAQNAELLLKLSHSDSLPDKQTIEQLFQDYLRMYSSRDDLLTAQFSEDFSGFTGGGDFLVKEKDRWIAITRQDFVQVKDSIRIELKDLAIQSLAGTIAVATGFLSIHLPMNDEILSRQTVRLVLIFRREDAGWKISHCSYSIPYHLVSAGEIYPLKELLERNESLERLVDERSNQLASANDNLIIANTELERLNALLQEQACEDALTGLANRRQFTAMLDQEIRRASRNNREISLLIADVDSFKHYNDTFGHLRGDWCLQRVAQVLKAAFRRPGELPVRFGGDEFAVILPNCGSDLGVVLAERLRRAMEEAGDVFPSSTVAPCITLSIGIASGRVEDGFTAEALIQAADNALYLSKAEGRNRVTVSTVGN